MSHTLSLFGVDRRKLKSAIGSRDEALVARIIQSNKAAFAVDEDEAVEDGLAPMSAIVRRLIDGDTISERGIVQSQVVYSFEQILKFLSHSGHVGYTDQWHQISALCVSHEVVPFETDGSLPSLAFVPGLNVPQLLAILDQEVSADGPDDAVRFREIAEQTIARGTDLFAVYG